MFKTLFTGLCSMLIISSVIIFILPGTKNRKIMQIVVSLLVFSFVYYSITKKDFDLPEFERPKTVQNDNTSQYASNLTELYKIKLNDFVENVFKENGLEYKKINVITDNSDSDNIKILYVELILNNKQQKIPQKVINEIEEYSKTECKLKFED